MTFELGVNYWPRRRAMYMWREHDLAEVRDDMAHIASMGFDVVRVFVLMEDFLPRPRTVATEMVERMAVLGHPGVAARTFHAAALAQLRHFWPSRHEGEPPPRIRSPIFGGRNYLRSSCSKPV